MFYTIFQNFPVVLRLNDQQQWLLPSLCFFPTSLWFPAPAIQTTDIRVLGLPQGLLLGGPRLRLPQTDRSHGADRASSKLRFCPPHTTYTHTHAICSKLETNLTVILYLHQESYTCLQKKTKYSTI